MSDYWMTQYFLAAVGWGYVSLALVAISLALWLPSGGRNRAVAACAVLGLLLIEPVSGYRGYVQERNADIERRAMAARVHELFETRCKNAGEKIYRTVENVEGVHLTSSRGTFAVSNYRDVNWVGAGFPNESSGAQYIMEFLFYNIPAHGDHARSLGPKPGGIRGYRYVDLVEDGAMSRYSLRDKADYKLVGASDPVERYGKRATAVPPVARYSVVYEDIPDSEGRALWIAGAGYGCWTKPVEKPSPSSCARQLTGAAEMWTASDSRGLSLSNALSRHMAVEPDTFDHLLSRCSSRNRATQVLAPVTYAPLGRGRAR